MALQSGEDVDWAALRRQIEDLAVQHERPPTAAELRRFLAEHGVGPELLGTFLASMAESKSVAAARPGPSSPVRKAIDTPPPSPPRPVAAPASPVVPLPKASPTGGKGDEAGTRLRGRLAEVVEDLVDDWHRQGGVLQRDQVISLAAKRKLTGAELATVDEELIRLGVETTTKIEEPETRRPRPRRPSARGDEDLVGAYLGEIARYPLIYAEDEVRLGRAIHAGQRAADTLAGSSRSNGPTAARLQAAVTEGRTAHTQLVEANLRLVVSVARQPRYAVTTTELIDRIQDGNRGLMRAADLFDPEMGFKFSTYATWWIKQAIERGVADTGRTIRLPVHVHEKLGKLRRARGRLTERLDREPTPFELAEATGYSPAQVQAMTDYLMPIRSLEEPAGDDTILLDLLADQADDVDGRGDPQDHFLTASRREELDAELDWLPSRQREVLVRRYDLHGYGIETLEAIAQTMSLTRERVRQLETKAFQALRSTPRVEMLYDYLLSDTRLDRPLPAAGWPPPSPPKVPKQPSKASRRPYSPEAARIIATMNRTEE